MVPANELPSAGMFPVQARDLEITNLGSLNKTAMH